MPSSSFVHLSDTCSRVPQGCTLDPACHSKLEALFKRLASPSPSYISEWPHAHSSFPPWLACCGFSDLVVRAGEIKGTPTPCSQRTGQTTRRAASQTGAFCLPCSKKENVMHARACTPRCVPQSCVYPLLLDHKKSRNAKCPGPSTILSSHYACELQSRIFVHVIFKLCMYVCAHVNAT